MPAVHPSKKLPLTSTTKTIRAKTKSPARAGLFNLAGV
jgi:hypothetical protein